MNDKSRVFENAVAFIQAKAEVLLDNAMKLSVVNLPKPVAVPSNETALAPEDVKESWILKDAKRQKLEDEQRYSPSAYICTSHISPTSCIVERLLSKAKHVLTDRRKSMYPETQELLLFLNHHKNMWETDADLQSALLQVGKEQV